MRTVDNSRLPLGEGVIVPMVTPAADGGKVDLAAAERLVEFVVDAGTAPFVLGTTGEGASVPLTERTKLVETTVRVAGGRQPVYAGISDNCFYTSVALAEKFFELGVDAVVAHAPCYYPVEPEALLSYFEQLADALPGPLVLYNIPATTHLSIPLEVVDKLSRHPQIIALKDSERDLSRLEQAAAKWKDRKDFSHLIGWAAKSVYGLRLGSRGIVPSTGNVIPRQFRELYDAALDSNFSAAEELQMRTDRVAAVYQRGQSLSRSLAALKGMLSLMGMCSTRTFPPLPVIDDEELRRIREEMIGLGLID